MITKHTPGPWRFEYYENNRAKQGHRVVGPAGEHDLVCDNEPYYPHAVSEEDARLIAAAPDLLAALESIVEMNPELPMGMIEAAQAAIAKTIGEQYEN